MRFATTSVLAALAALTSAQFTPTGSSPTGNPIGHPELGELMKAGSPFTITWTPTTSDNVSLLLLQGPSSNVIPIFTIVDSTPNTGSYTWDVPTSLAPATTGYGVQLVDSDGTFQYSPQCGISNSEYSSSATGPGTTSGTYITMTLSTGANYTGPTAIPTISAAGNSSVALITPTAALTVPSTLQSTIVVTPSNTFFSATPPAQPTQTAVTGAGVPMNAGLGFAGLAGLVAAFAL